uniref:Uncharacterized protein n=1 Tax=Bos indicus x Bos taurus TaxID=30522 RepID=A0A4W2GNM4_BOBOX
GAGGPGGHVCSSQPGLSQAGGRRLGGTRALGCAGSEGLEVDLLVEGAAPQAEVEALAVAVLHGVDHLFGHAHGERQVAPHLAHHDGGADVLGLDLHVLARHLLGDFQAVGPVLLPTVLGAVCEGGRQLVHLSLVHLLVHTLLEVLEDDGELWARRGTRPSPGLIMTLCTEHTEGRRPQDALDCPFPVLVPVR